MNGGNIDPMNYDVVICGGGPAGTAAAIAAAENGEKTLLVEENSELGGTGTSGGVSHWLGGRSRDCTKFVIGGIFQRLVEQAVSEGIALLPQPEKSGHSPFGWLNGHLTAGIPFDRFLMAEFLERHVLAAGAEILYRTRLIDCTLDKDRDRIEAVELHNKSGKFAVRAKRFIDATGDADLAALAGVPFVVGEDVEHGCAPASLEFHVDHVDADVLKRYIDEHDSPRFLSEIRELTERGVWKFPFDRLITVQMTEKDHFMVNTPRLVGVDALDGRSITDGLIRGRKMVLELFRILKAHFPGFANARLCDVAPMLGIRESRRIEGRYTLTVDDVVSGKTFPDTIGYCCYSWDLPDPKRPSYQPISSKDLKIRNDRIPIPYRIMLPKKILNLHVPGRAVSVERPVLGPIRVMASCMLMGEAAGRNSTEYPRD